jgi:hypothetical protein
MNRICDDKIRSIRRLIGSGVLSFAAFILSSCGGATEPQIPIVELQSSFEAGLEGWTVDATDIIVGGAEIPWWVRPGTALAFEGSSALEFYMANYTDAAKIWIVRPIAVPANLPYRVTISYSFGTKDYGDLNLFSLVSGAASANPRSLASDPSRSFVHEATSNGAPNDVGYRWIQKQTEVNVVSNAEGYLYVVVGVWGNWETERTYYVDALHVQVYPR